MYYVVFFIFFFLPFALYILRVLTKVPLLGILACIIAILFGAYTVNQNVQLDVSYVYNSVTSSWLVYSYPIPLMPYSIIAYILGFTFLLFIEFYFLTRG